MEKGHSASVRGHANGTVNWTPLASISTVLVLCHDDSDTTIDQQLTLLMNTGGNGSKPREMMCEVMPTISEDTALSQRGSQSSASDPDSHSEQLMVNMLDERDRLLDTLRETQESLGLAQQHLEDVIYDRDSLQRQLSSALPQ
ncbi:hypothetical protein MATL_G00248650 [Megalops atlanticus]|uniref:Uncharacterized protein n=1 Tax=Megalops atlanticus TaxID=7932 RepID=A0A9D3PCM2_MEGAT|nr:hypothetical protein MATL_G00248650 [Megalops atlanticus]